MNPTIVKVVKITSMVCSVIGMLGSAWAGTQENKVILQDLVNKQFQNQ